MWNTSSTSPSWLCFWVLVRCVTVLRVNLKHHRHRRRVICSDAWGEGDPGAGGAAVSPPGGARGGWGLSGVCEVCGGGAPVGARSRQGLHLRLRLLPVHVASRRLPRRRRQPRREHLQRCVTLNSPHCSILLYKFGHYLCRYMTIFSKQLDSQCPADMLILYLFVIQ